MLDCRRLVFVVAAGLSLWAPGPLYAKQFGPDHAAFGSAGQFEQARSSRALPGSVGREIWTTRAEQVGFAYAAEPARLPENGQANRNVSFAAPPSRLLRASDLDPSVVAAGKAAFEESCTQCHKAEMALDKRKDFHNWLATAVRMATQEDADIPPEDLVPIATYLTSLNPAAIEPEPPPSMPQRPGFDPRVVTAGRAAFGTSCVDCHDADRSLQKRKDLTGWLSTVRRMARKEDANVAPGDVVPIATYLASLNPAAAEATGAGAQTAAAASASEPEFDLYGTVSAVHLSGAKEVLENPGFFPEVWVGAEWRPRSSSVSARVNACVTCHSEGAGGGSRIELAEGFVRYDVLHRPDGSEEHGGKELSVDGGRFIVPFGAFAAKSHPAAFRTATRPLMYNMGQNVHRDDLGPPILPMPYADEGFRVTARAPIVCEELTATADAYVVNGLQGGSSVNFFFSRDYVDNNSQPAVGGRLTLGTKRVRGGVSIMSGQFSADGSFGPAADGLHYKIYGADLTARWEDRLRVHVEYAQRTSDLLSIDVVEEDLQGLLLEGELKVWDRPRIALVVRYDEQSRSSPIAVPGSRIPTGDFTVDRITWGINVALAGGSTLIINHEHWDVPGPLRNVDVLGVRWVGAF